MRAFYTNGTFVAGDSHFRPLSAITLNRTDADINLFFLSDNAILFAERTPDPWYNGTSESVVTTIYSDHDGNIIDVLNSTEYYGADAASPLGCRVQEQFCNPNLRDPSNSSLPLCAPLSGYLDSARLAIEHRIWPDEPQHSAAAVRIDWFEALLHQRRQLTVFVNALRSRALLARYTLTTAGTQARLPDNQWMLDVSHWLGIQLADMQAATIAMTTGPINEIDFGLPYETPNKTEQLEICRSVVCNFSVSAFTHQKRSWLTSRSQKILSTDHSSFSILGLILCVVLGALIVLTSYLLDPILTFLQRRYHVREYARLEWNSNGVLQLQRLAHEGLGSGVVVKTQTRTRTRTIGSDPQSPSAGSGDTVTDEIETEEVEVKEGWDNSDDLVPVTPGRGLKLASLDISDRRHPRLRAVDSRSGIMQAGLNGFDRHETLKSLVDDERGGKSERKAGVVMVEEAGDGRGGSEEKRNKK